MAHDLWIENIGHCSSFRKTNVLITSYSSILIPIRFISRVALKLSLTPFLSL